MKVGFRYEIVYDRVTTTGLSNDSYTVNNAYFINKLYIGKTYVGDKVLFSFKNSVSGIETWHIPVNSIKKAKCMNRKPYFRIGDVVRINTTYNIEYVLKITELFIDKFNNFITAGHNPNFEIIPAIKNNQRYYCAEEIDYNRIPLDKIKSFEVL